MVDVSASSYHYKSLKVKIYSQTLTELDRSQVIIKTSQSSNLICCVSLGSDWLCPHPIQTKFLFHVTTSTRTNENRKTSVR